MKIRRIIHPRSKSIIFHTVLKLIVPTLALLLSFTFFADVAIADQIILNGDFENNTAGWKFQKIVEGVKIKRDNNGHDGKGSLHFSVSGHRIKGETRAVQLTNTPIQAGSSGRIEFAWKKNWSTVMPKDQRIYINIIKPNNKYVTVWIHRSIQNDNMWAAQSVDISKFLDQSGRYSLNFGISLENGSSKDAATAIWLDDIKMDVSSPAMDTNPKTSLLNPTGSSMLTGNTALISGIAVDDVKIKKVEVALIKIQDNSFWNSDSWLKSEVWNEATIVSGKGKSTSTWSYSWSLPTSDGSIFKILARSTDIMGNQELIPVENYVKVDNVSPSGKIYINNAAAYANSRRAQVTLKMRCASKMRFSLDNGLTWTKWEEYTPTKTLMLPKGDGAKVVSAQFQDDRQNLYQTSDSITLDTTPPVTRHIYPQINAVKVSPSANIAAVFYENLDPLSLKNDGTERGSTVYIKQGSRWIATQVEYNRKAKTTRLIPMQKLDEGTTYTVYLRNGIKDAAGNPLAANFSWSFTTAGTYKSSFKKTIGRSGGLLEDNRQIISLDIPQNVLSADARIVIEELRDENIPSLNGATRYSAVYLMTPQRLPFVNPATLRIKFKPDAVPDPTSLRLVSYDDVQKKWQLVPNASVDLVNNQIIAPIPYLTTVTIMAQNDPTAPSTAIMSPTGTAELKELTNTIFGISTDNGSISKVEIEIMRQPDNRYWNGSGWQVRESWVKAKITSGEKRSQVTWSYIWTLPKNRYDNYQVRARATDNNGNMEPNPDIVQLRIKASK